MPNKNYRNGVYRERVIMKEYEKEGYVCFRSAGSHGLFDVIAINPWTKRIYLIQAKTGKAPLSKREKEKITSALSTFRGDYKVIPQLNEQIK